MKIFTYLLLLIVPLQIFGQEIDSIKTEKNFKIVPLITSTPLMGWGVGASTSYLYNADKSNASKSQLNVGGQYSSTKSYSLFAKNNLWFNDNGVLSSTNVMYSDINNEFEDDEFGDVKYKINSFIIAEVLMFRVANNIYIGAPLSYKSLTYTPNNDEGKDFMEKNGFRDEHTGGYGFMARYDSRKNKYYPSNSAWITAIVNNNPEWLGSVNNYYSFVVDARYYAKGFRANDVWAWQFYGQYCTDKTPDSGLPTLSGKSILRGYPAGQFKAKYQSGAQTEYRYTISNSRFRLVGFFGIANMSGGSIGITDEDGNHQYREDDGWYSAEGIGVRYILQQVTGVDLRLDLVHTSEGQISFYLKLNQAF